MKSALLGHCGRMSTLTFNNKERKVFPEKSEGIQKKLAGIISVDTILGDPGAVSRAERKGVTKVFKNRRKSHWVPTLTGPFPNGQVNAGSWLGTKNALYYCAQSANSISWVLFVNSYTAAIVSSQLPGSFTKLVRARENRLTVSKWSSESRYPGALPSVLENFRRAFSPSPTDCPWVSENALTQTCRFK